METKDAKINIKKENNEITIEIKGLKRDITIMLATALTENEEFRVIVTDALLVHIGDELGKRGINLNELLREATRVSINMQPSPFNKPKERTVN